MKLTFKKQPKAKGLAGVGYPYQSTDMKLDGKVFGHISAPDWRTETVWKVRIAVKKSEPDDNPNCDWKWATFVKDFESDVDAREFIQSNISQIVEKHNLHFFDWD